MLEIILLILLILLNAFFAGSEIALISLNDNKIRMMADEGNQKAIRLKQLLGEPSKFLATIQIGITLAGFLASAFAAKNFSDRLVVLLRQLPLPIPENWLNNIALLIITILLSYITLLFGELVPKRVAMKKAEPISMFVVGPLNLLSSVSSPFVKFLTNSTNFVVRLFGVDPHQEDERVTEEEIRMMVDVGEEKGTIHETEKEMINNIFELNNKTVLEVMTHRTDIAALPVGASFETVISFVNQEKYSRIPVFEGNIDNIIGVLHTKYLIEYLTKEGAREKFKLRDVIRPPYFVPEFKRTDELLKDLKQNKNHLAVIIDEYGGTAGIVTLEDLIEEIVGNIFDEDDEVEQDIFKLDENTFLLNGTTSVDEVEDFFSVGLPTGEYETISGFIISQLGRIPGKDDNSIVEFNGLIFKVEEADEKIVAKIKVLKNELKAE